MEEERLVIMVKDPARSKVKTRLAEELGHELAEALYRAFVADILKTVRQARLDCTVAFSPEGSRNSVQEWIGRGIPLLEQVGDDLGARMKNIFLNLFREGCRRVILVGSDIPDLTGDFIKEAFLRLGEGNAVIGPALDGGYFLIGFAREGFLPDIFEGIEWGSSGVFGATMRVFEKRERQVSVLSPWSDVDTVADLKALFARHQNTEFRDSGTMGCILEHKAHIFW
jgi:uncharacterized protein